MSDDITFDKMLEYDIIDIPENLPKPDEIVLRDLNILLSTTKARITIFKNSQTAYASIPWYNICRKLSARNKIRKQADILQASCNFYHCARHNIVKLVLEPKEDTK